MSRAWGKGSTRQWRKIRQLALVRDREICQLRHEGVCTYRATEVHHLDGKAAGDHLDRVVSTCRECNQLEGDPTQGDPEPDTWILG